MTEEQIDNKQFYVLGILLVVISLLHYLTPTHIHLLHEIYRRLYFIPVIFGAYWYGLRGGLITALLSTLLYLPHIIFQWRHLPEEAPGQYGEIIMFWVVAAITGVLADREKGLMEKQREAAIKLESAYRKLQDSMEQIRRADRLSAVGQLSAGIAHELRNPLGSIKGAVDLLMDDLPDEHPSGEFAGIIKKETARLQRLLDDFLAYARPSEPSFGPVELQTLVPQVMRLLANEADRRNCSLESGIPEGLERVKADEAQLFQVLVNLLLNAMQAIDVGGRVKIIASPGPLEGMVELSIEDDGPGIGEGNMEKLFDPFFTTRDEGTGLGLSVVYSIMETHGGSVDAANLDEGGAIITLTLPVWEEEQRE